MVIHLELSEREYNLLHESLEIACAFSTLSAYAHDADYSSFNRVLDFRFLLSDVNKNFHVTESSIFEE